MRIPRHVPVSNPLAVIRSTTALNTFWRTWTPFAIIHDVTVIAPPPQGTGLSNSGDVPGIVPVADTVDPNVPVSVTVPDPSGVHGKKVDTHKEHSANVENAKGAMPPPVYHAGVAKCHDPSIPPLVVLVGQNICMPKSRADVADPPPHWQVAPTKTTPVATFAVVTVLGVDCQKDPFQIQVNVVPQ
jgi:hypothetical protein